MYKQNFCVCIKDAKRNPLQEHGATIELPFDSEYFISLQNKHKGKRAVVNVKIDGKDAADIVLLAEGRLDLERFLTGEDLQKGNKFKFVSLNDKDVQDPGDSQNGNIKVSVKFEKNIWDIKTRPTQPIWILPRIGDLPWRWWGNVSTGDPLISPSVTTCYNITNTFYKDSCTLTGVVNCKSSVEPEQLGATVKGSESMQAFSLITIGELEDEAIVFNLRLIAPLKLIKKENPKLREDESFCFNCGKTLKNIYKFCTDCGEKQPS
ncbi:MAG: hypothetical protein M0R17_01490 [Candidatus Omnitrophica bacterium]|nr:hypothetical protein [Candidatus Omnitrophota bacterium]